MNQKVAWGLLCAGFAVTCYAVREIIGDHSSWYELTEPQAVKHAAGVLIPVSVTLAGALGVDLGKLAALLNRERP